MTCIFFVYIIEWSNHVLKILGKRSTHTFKIREIGTIAPKATFKLQYTLSFRIHIFLTILSLLVTFLRHRPTMSHDRGLSFTHWSVFASDRLSYTLSSPFISLSFLSSPFFINSSLFLSCFFYSFHFTLCNYEFPSN